MVSGPTLAIGGQPVGRLPVFVAPQDVVGDVDVAGGHVVDALGDGHASRRARGPSGSAPRPSTAGRGGAEREWGRGPVDPAKHTEAVRE